MYKQMVKKPQRNTEIYLWTTIIPWNTFGLVRRHAAKTKTLRQDSNNIDLTLFLRNPLYNFPKDKKLRNIYDSVGAYLRPSGRAWNGCAAVIIISKLYKFENHSENHYDLIYNIDGVTMDTVYLDNYSVTLCTYSVYWYLIIWFV